MKTLAGPAWMFDDSPIPDPFGRAAKALDFIGLLKHPKSTRPDKSLVLDHWQRRLIEMMLGPAYPDGRRICRTVFLQVGRGNRKTSLAAAIALLFTFGSERTPAGQVLSAASDRKQARIAFEEALGIVQSVPEIAAAAQPQDFRNRLRHPKSGAFYEAVSSDAVTQFGRTPIFAHVDELWAHKNVGLWNAIRTGLAKTPGSLLFITTTAGAGNTTPDFAIYEYAKKVAAGEVENPGFLPIIFEADPKADWTDQALWHQVNPGLVHGYPDLEGLRALALEARDRPVDRAAFCQFHLGIRQQHSVAPFVEMAIYDRCADEVDLDALAGAPCWIGVDCSSTTDLTSVVASFRDGDDGYFIAPWFFVPKDNLQLRADRDQVPYPRWAEEGFIIPTEGNAIDPRAIEAKIRELVQSYDVREIAFDRAYGQAVMGPLNDDGLPVVTLQQGWVTQSPALNELERAIITGKLRHGGHPVLRWNFENVVIHTDSGGNRVMHKGKSRDRIDGAAATWMAISRANASNEGGSSVFDRAELWPAISGSSDDGGIDYAILQDPRHPSFHTMRERWERANLVDEDF